jgi:queuine tRNA-ribosyltransferase
VSGILPEEKPRHLLGIGEPIDIFFGVEHGMDTFDCVAPTRQGRNGSVYTLDGRKILKNKEFTTDLGPIDAECGCYTCTNHQTAYVSHLLRSGEMLGGILASIHNIYFIVNLVKKMRTSIIDGSFYTFKEQFLKRYYGK